MLLHVEAQCLTSWFVENALEENLLRAWPALRVEPEKEKSRIAFTGEHVAQWARHGC